MTEFSQRCILLVIISSYVTGLTQPTTKANGDPDLASIISLVTLMEQTISSLQTQVQDSNSELSTVKSKLQAAENQLQSYATELAAVKTQQQITQDELNKVKEGQKVDETDLASLKDDRENSPNHSELQSLKSELEAFKVSHTALIHDVLTTKREANRTAVSLQNTRAELGSLSSQIVAANTKFIETIQHIQAGGNVTCLDKNSGGDVAFQVTQRQDGSSNWTTLKFDTVDFNAGSGYDKTTGMFTAPIPGTYIFWANVEYTYPTQGNYLTIYKGQQELATGYHMMKDLDVYGVASTMTVTHLDKGDQVHFTTGSTIDQIFGYGDSSYGGALLRAV